MERRGEVTILGTLNRDIVKFNSVRKHLRKVLAELKEWIEEIKKILSEFKEEKVPSIADVLIDYLNSRQEAHSGKSRYYYNNVKYQKQEQSREINKPTKIHNQNIE